MTDRQTDRPTNLPTDGRRTDRVIGKFPFQKGENNGMKSERLIINSYSSFRFGVIKFQFGFKVH